MALFIEKLQSELIVLTLKVDANIELGNWKPSNEMHLET